MRAGAENVPLLSGRAAYVGSAHTKEIEMIETVTKDGRWTLGDDGSLTHFSTRNHIGGNWCGVAVMVKPLTAICEECGARLSNRTRSWRDEDGRELFSCGGHADTIIRGKRYFDLRKRELDEGTGSQELLDNALWVIREYGGGRDASCDRRAAVEHTRAKYGHGYISVAAVGDG